MDLLLVTTDLLLGAKPVATGKHRADEGVGGHEILLHGSGDFGMLLLKVRLKFVGAIEGPGYTLLPAGEADMILLRVIDLLDPLVDISLVPVEIPDQGEAEGT